VIQRGKNAGYIECDVEDENGKQVAKASSRCLVLRDDAAKGR
jgi:acyl-coenzyme A thioesterase PaaI-like protein